MQRFFFCSCELINWSVFSHVIFVLLSIVGGKFSCVNVHAEVYVFLIIYSVSNQTDL